MTAKLKTAQPEAAEARECARQGELVLEQTEHSLLKLDSKLQQMMSNYEKLGLEFAKMQQQYSGAYKLQLAKQELEKQVEALKLVVRERDCTISELCDQLQSGSVTEGGHMSFSALGDRSSFSDDRVRILTNFYSWELLKAFHILVVNHERAAEGISLWGDQPLNLNH